MKVLQDPSEAVLLDSVSRAITRVRKEAEKAGLRHRLILHYTFTPRPEKSKTRGAPWGEYLILYDVAQRSHVRVPISHIYKRTDGNPMLFIFDCPQGAELVSAMQSEGESMAADSAGLGTILAIARSANSRVDYALPASLLSDCLVDPIQAAVRFHIWLQ